MSNDEKYVFYGGSLEEPIEAGCHSLGELIIKRLKENGDGVAFIDGVTDEKYTYADVLERSVRLANRFHRLGIKKDTVVAVMCENRIELPIVSFAATYLRAIPILLNPGYTATELAHVLKYSQPRAIFASPLAMATLQPLLRTVPSIKLTVLFGDKKPHPKVTLFSELFDRNRAQYISFTPQPAKLPDQVGLMVLSSGTTGLPKAVQLTHHNIMCVLAYMRENASVIPFEQISLGLLPFFHVYGYMVLMHSLINKRVVVSLPRFEPTLFLSTIQKYRVTIASLAPPLMVFLAKHPLVDKYDLSSLVFIGCGAAPLSKELELAVMKRLPHLQMILVGYGLSETSLGVTTRASDVHGSVGKVNKLSWLKVVDVKTGRTLGPHQTGEICVKGPLVMKGYLHNERETRAMIDRDGWLHTGDTGYFDEDENFYIVDRIKDLIKYKGFQVPPAEVEAVLLTHPGIKDCAVVGRPDVAAGQLPVAFVVLQPGAKLTETEVQQYVAERLSKQKQLHGGVRFVHEIPKTASGKILRRELVALFPKAKL
uniref:Luciferin 4-monooxygenase n=1 Tax=Anopheles quadriannulatus TaxID=34691 RepID=A0A182WW21_ANOQN